MILHCEMKFTILLNDQWGRFHLMFLISLLLRLVSVICVGGFIINFQLNCVPSDQNMVELVLPEMENFPPNVFLILFAVHGEHGGFGMDFNRLNNLRLSGNPCLIEEVIWHKPRIANQKEEFTSLDGLQSVARLGPYEPGKTLEQYKLDTFDTHFITVLEYVPFRKNKYTISMMPGRIIKGNRSVVKGNVDFLIPSELIELELSKNHVLIRDRLYIV